MKLKRRIAEPPKKARIEIIPLIDIMFFLLATFVMVSTAMIKNKGIVVNLPSAETGSAEERRDYAAITVSEDGTFFFNKEQISRELLPQRLSEFKSITQDPKVFINGDARADLEAVVTALDEVRRAGISKVALETKAKS